jgi:hypothetical protein
LTGPYPVVDRNESVWKNIFKKGYEEIRDRNLLEIWKKDRTWLKYEYMSKCQLKQKQNIYTHVHVLLLSRHAKKKYSNKNESRENLYKHLNHKN